MTRTKRPKLTRKQNMQAWAIAISAVMLGLALVVTFALLMGATSLPKQHIFYIYPN
jgi:predicted membrane protein